MTFPTPHATAADVLAVAQGTAPAEHRAAVLAHLEAGCPTCEAAFEAALDDDTLARLAAAEAATPVRLPRVRTPRRHLLLWGAAALALAATLLISVLPTPPTLREKGPTSSAVVTLQIAVAREEGGRLTVDHLALPGERLPRDAVLLFEIDVDRPAARTLFVVDSTGRATPVWPATDAEIPIEAAGPRRVAAGGEWVAFDVADQRGEVRFVAGASTEPIGAAELRGRWPTGDTRVGWAAMTVEVNP